MRSLIDGGGGRRRRPSARDRSRFRATTGEGGRDLIRFRRNREALWREGTTLVLWILLVFLLLDLSSTLHRVSQVHLSERGLLLRLLLPAMAIGAAVFCGVKARANLLEVLDIRREQAGILARLRSLRDAGPPPHDDAPGD